VNAKVYRQAVLAALSAELRPLGYRKRGMVFLRELADVIHVVALQSSTQSTTASLRVTVNLGVWVPALADEAEHPGPWTAHWRERLGGVMPDSDDLWWTIDAPDAEPAVSAAMVVALRAYGLPALATLPNAAALLALWQNGRSPGQTAGAATRLAARLIGLIPTPRPG
jgi:hypothetical protein